MMEIDLNLGEEVDVILVEITMIGLNQSVVWLPLMHPMDIASQPC